jgi:Glycosyltransferase family 87
MRSLRSVLVAFFFTALGLVALRDVVRLGTDLPWHVMYDFPDFYCGGEILDERADPYTYEPLRSCEHGVNRAPSFEANPGIAIPAPQPPYAFALFMALAKLSFAPARAIYAAVIVVAVLLAAGVLTRLGIPADIALLGVALSGGYLQLDAGQITPLALLALVATGWMLSRRRDALAGLFGALTTIEPHLGAGVVLSLFIFAPRTRWSLIATTAALIAGALVLAGPSLLLTYVTRVVPLQGVAEVAFPPQYSLTYALHAFGFSDAAALRIGAIAFGALLAAGLAVAPRLATNLQRREMLAFFPAATAVMAGVYVHVIELCFAIPAALVLAYYGRGVWRTVAAIAASILAVPWILVWGFKKLWMASAFVVAGLLYRLRVPAATGIISFAAVIAAIYVLERNPPWLPSAAPNSASSYAPGALVQVEWGAVASGLDDPDPLWIYIKIPAWGALAALFVAGAALARRRPMTGASRETA